MASELTTSRRYLTEQQYATDRNLAARQAIYRFRRPAASAPGWPLDLLDLRGDERVLDVGCGNGVYLADLARRGHAGPVTGMDLSAGMLAAARMRADDRVALVLADAQRLPFPDTVFDVTMAMHMLYHVPDRAAAIEELRRVTDAAGAALVLTNANEHLAELNELIAVSADAAGADAGLARRAYHRFTSESAEGELRATFSEVTPHHVEAELVVTEAAAVVDYVRSTRPHLYADGPHPVLDEVERRVAAAIAAHGAFRVRAKVSSFVCR